jgi:hypothetical protein
MEEYKLEHWKRLTNFRDHITLANADCYASLECIVHQDGKLVLKTSSGQSHGEPSFSDKGRKYEDWMKLLEEAKRVHQFYYKK